MNNKELNCPSCGAVLELKYRFSKMAVCKYCGQTTHLVNDTIVSTDVKSTPLVDYGSIFSVGQFVNIKDLRFEIIGRIRFSYPSGFWDEWFLFNANKPEEEYWLQEDEGEYILFERSKEVNNFPDFNGTQIGDLHENKSEKIFVSEKNTAEIKGGEGELPFQVVRGEQANFIDGIVVGKGTPVSYEFLPKETLLYEGSTLELNEIIIKQ